ncbi:hypothetical protein [uncultured Olegusella sp.]|uniref:carboxylate--amine ligase n=1 Tax=uncultured Olegusella sp. TaxID=1979846 RepID=UPI00262F4FA9|nr:hypothetical protein [uncultured Olegusella sp.]
MVTLQPIILGTESGVYGSARSFHEAFSINSWAWGRLSLSATKASKIVTPSVTESFTDPEIFIKTMSDKGEKLKKDNLDTHYVVVPGGDDYSRLLSQYRDELSNWYDINAVDYDLHLKLSDKKSFYELCDIYQLPHPATFILNESDFQQQTHHNLPFGFPVALKPADSVEWNLIDFPGRKKAYRIETSDELDSIISTIFTAGYRGDLIIQDFIPGGDECMKVLNAYVTKNHKVTSMVLGQIVLSDPTPYAIGNYSAIIPVENDAFCMQIAEFLESIGYQGFANFDIKYDPRDGIDKLFEINLRPGRTAYFATANGLNVGKSYVDDLVFHKEPVETNYLHGSKMLLEVPANTLRHYAQPGSAYDCAMKHLREKSYSWTLDYGKDRSLMRRLYLLRLAQLAKNNFKLYGTPYTTTVFS